jgi:hypothetical protein
VEGAGLVTAGRRAGALAVAFALAVPLLAGCDAAQQAHDVAQGVDKARDCAALVGELTGVDWSAVRRNAAEAERAARRLDERLREVDDADVRRAGEALATRARRLADAVRNADRATIQRRLAEVEAAARQLADTCGVSVDQVGG